MSDGVVVWITGRPAAGKSVLAEHVAARLREEGAAYAVLDSDAVREALSRPAGAGPAERDAFYEALARLAALLARQGLVVLVPATAHRRAYRARARELAPRFLEVYVATSAEECERRDPKALYARARAGAASGLPGVDEAYEEPVVPDVTAHGGEDDCAASHVALLALWRAGVARRARG